MRGKYWIWLDFHQKEIDEPANGIALSGIAGEKYRWPNGELPYRISSSLSSGNKKKVENAINEFNQKLGGCIRIRPKTSRDRNYVLVTRGNPGVCQSHVGREGKGEQTLLLG